MRTASIIRLWPEMAWKCYIKQGDPDDKGRNPAGLLHLKETDRKIDKLEGFFTSQWAQWGRLVEAMVAPAALALFWQRGIDVVETMQRVVVKRGGPNKEFDIILVNGDTVVVVEVKSILKVDDVREHLRCLERLFDYLPEHRGKRIPGAMAYIASDEQSERYAAGQGFFVIGLTGENLVSIRNPPDFVPRDFGLQGIVPLS
ncbi:MAG: hypothetical protein ABIJ86_08700 [Spirochaetota bacterium]